MSVPIVWLDEAVDDLDAILDYIEKQSPRGALTMALAIRQGANLLLSDYPNLGRRGRVKGTCEFVIARTPFILVHRFRQKPARVEVIRVLHGARQWPPAR